MLGLLLKTPFIRFKGKFELTLKEKVSKYLNFKEQIRPNSMLQS
jgi:hypothetical protein